MTNPNNAVGTNGAYGGRTSVNALNDILSSYNGRGIVSGWNCQASSGMTVTLGGVVGSRDVAIAEDNIGNKTTVNNISASPIEVTLPTAPTANNRIDLIVAYVANPPQGSATVVDNPSACGLIVVSSAVAANPTVPTDANIRTAITEDGATGTNAYYVIMTSIAVSAGLSTITDNLITQGSSAGLNSNNIANDSITPEKVSGTFWYSATNGDPVTITKDGVYDISAQISNPGTTGGLYIQVQSSGSSSWTAVSSAYSAATVWNGISVRKIIALNAGDKVRAVFNNSAIQTDQAYNQFNIVEVLGANPS